LKAIMLAAALVSGLAIAGGTTYFAMAEDKMEGMDHSKMDHSKMDHSKMDDASMAEPPSTKAYKAGMDRMMSGMMVPYTGNADVDFVTGMIPHHQGAIDMAKVVLEFGKDPAIRKLAEDIIKAQDSEIAFMQDWLKKNPVK
jgi:uncharacterized protein (DUF305 family)